MTVGLNPIHASADVALDTPTKTPLVVLGKDIATLRSTMPPKRWETEYIFY